MQEVCQEKNNYFQNKRPLSKQKVVLIISLIIAAVSGFFLLFQEYYFVDEGPPAQGDEIIVVSEDIVKDGHIDIIGTNVLSVRLSGTGETLPVLLDESTVYTSFAILGELTGNIEDYLEMKEIELSDLQEGDNILVRGKMIRVNGKLYLEAKKVQVNKI